MSDLTKFGLVNQPSEIDPELVVVLPDRHRQRFNRKPLEELIDSMRQVGQIQAGLCKLNEAGSIELLVGERRLKACIFLKIPFKFYLKENITDPLLLEQIQLDENLVREDLDWKEEVRALKRLHEIFQSRFGSPKPGLPGGHSLKDTAEHIGIGKTILFEDIALASLLDIPEIAAAQNKTTAKKIALTLSKQVKRHDTLQAVLANVKSADAPTPLTATAKAEVAGQREKQAEVAKTLSPAEKQLLYFDSKCILGSMEEKIGLFKDESFDIVFFDPPWGVDFDKVKRESPGTKSYADDASFFFEKIEEWLTLIYAKMKPNSHLYMFFGMGTAPEGEEEEKSDLSEGFKYRDHIYDLLHKIGFKTNRMPLIWWKQGCHATRNPAIWPGRSYEPIAYARKGSKALVKFGQPDVIPTPMPTQAIKDIHPSAKHPQIYRELLLRSAGPGDFILDPMGGSGMLGVAAESLAKTHSLNWFMIEKDNDFRTLQIMNLAKGYEALAKKETPQEEVSKPNLDQPNIELQDFRAAESFKSLVPGTPSWQAWWKEHKEDQDAMLKWKLQLSRNG